MVPVLPSFAGFVPAALARVFPHAPIRKSNGWLSFPRTYYVEPASALFGRIGKTPQARAKPTPSPDGTTSSYGNAHPSFPIWQSAILHSMGLLYALTAEPAHLALCRTVLSEIQLHASASGV